MPRITRTATLAGVAGAAAIATIGLGASQALAETTPAPSASASPQSGEAPSTGAPTDRGGAGHGRGGFKGGGASALAEALGLDEATVQATIEKVREGNKPTELPAQGTKPTDAEHEARQTAYVTALAKELGVSEDKVTAALEKVRSAHATERRSALSEKLDAAIKVGSLTAADKASVLKALDAGVLGGSAR